MKKILTTKKRIVIAVGASAVVLGSGGAAFAFYLSTGSGAGTAAVGTTSNNDFTLTADPITAMYPGDVDTVTVTVTNNTTHALSFNTVTATGATDSTGTDKTDVLDSTGKNPVIGCLATWFGGSSTAPSSPISVDGGKSTTVQVPVTFTNEIATNQDACQAATNGIELNYQITG